MSSTPPSGVPESTTEQAARIARRIADARDFDGPWTPLELRDQQQFLTALKQQFRRLGIDADPTRSTPFELQKAVEHFVASDEDPDLAAKTVAGIDRFTDQQVTRRLKDQESARAANYGSYINAILNIGREGRSGPRPHPGDVLVANGPPRSTGSPVDPTSDPPRPAPPTPDPPSDDLLPLREGDTVTPSRFPTWTKIAMVVSGVVAAAAAAATVFLGGNSSPTQTPEPISPTTSDFGDDRREPRQDPIEKAERNESISAADIAERKPNETVLPEHKKLANELYKLLKKENPSKSSDQIHDAVRDLMNDIDKSSVVKSLNRNLYANVGNQTPLTIATLKAAYADGIEQAIADGKTKAAAKIASHAEWVTSLSDEDFGDYLKFKLIAEKLYKGEPLENRQKAFLNDVKEDAVQKLLDNTMTSSRDTAGVDR